MVGICVLTLLLGLASIPTKEWALDRKAMSNIFEWNLSILLVAYFLLAYIAWRKTGFPAERPMDRAPGEDSA